MALEFVRLGWQSVLRNFNLLTAGSGQMALVDDILVDTWTIGLAIIMSEVMMAIFRY